MGKDFLSYVLLIGAALVAYVSVSDYLDRTLQSNFTTPTVVQINQKAVEIGTDVEYSVGVNIED